MLTLNDMIDAAVRESEQAEQDLPEDGQVKVASATSAPTDQDEGVEKLATVLEFIGRRGVSSFLEKEAAAAVDEAIHRQYRLWPCNYIAHDTISGEETYCNEYNPSEREAFLSQYDNLKPEIRDVVLQCFANPVDSRNRAECSVTEEE